MTKLRKFIKGFTLVEAIVAAVLLSIVVGGASEYYIGKVKESKDADIDAIVQSITTSTGKSLAAACSSEIQRRMDSLAAGGASQDDINDNVITISNSARQSVISVIQEHFKDPVFYGKDNTTDPLQRKEFGADSVTNDAPILTLGDNKSISIPIVFNVVKRNPNPEYQDATPKIDSGVNNKVEVHYANKTTDLKVDLHNTVTATVYVDAEQNLKINSLSDIVNSISSQRIKPTDVNFSMVTQGATSNNGNQGSTSNRVTAPHSSSSAIANPLSEEFLKRLQARVSENNIDVNEGVYDNSTSTGTSTTPVQKNVTVCSPTHTKVYDGTPLSAKDWYFLDGQGLGQHAYITDVKMDASITDVGTVTNSIIYTAIDNDKYTDYNINTTEGTLTITKRDITFESISLSKHYDGKVIQGYEQAWIKSGSLAPTDQVRYVFCPLVYVTGENPNEFAVRITDKNTGVDKTKNYNITKIYGTLAYNNTTTAPEATDEPLIADPDNWDKAHVCLILDKSGSMKYGSKITYMRETGNRFLNAILQMEEFLITQDNEYVLQGLLDKIPERNVSYSIILFDGSASVLVSPQKLTKDSPRLTSSNYKYGGSTNIGAGLKLGFETVLNKTKENGIVVIKGPAATSGKIFAALLTDGEDVAGKNQDAYDYMQEYKDKWELVLMGAGTNPTDTRARYGFSTEKTHQVSTLDKDFDTVMDTALRGFMRQLKYYKDKETQDRIDNYEGNKNKRHGKK